MRSLLDRPFAVACVLLFVVGGVGSATAQLPPPCPPGTTGISPDCVPVPPPECPAGTVGVPPECIPPETPEWCPPQTVGVPPVCEAFPPQCPTNTVGAPPNCLPYCANDSVGTTAASLNCVPTCWPPSTSVPPTCVPDPTCHPGSIGLKPDCDEQQDPTCLQWIRLGEPESCVPSSFQCRWGEIGAHVGELDPVPGENYDSLVCLGPEECNSLSVPGCEEAEDGPCQTAALPPEVTELVNTGKITVGPVTQNPAAPTTESSPVCTEEVCTLFAIPDAACACYIWSGYPPETCHPEAAALPPPCYPEPQEDASFKHECVPIPHPLQDDTTPLVPLEPWDPCSREWPPEQMPLDAPIPGAVAPWPVPPPLGPRIGDPPYNPDVPCAEPDPYFEEGEVKNTPFEGGRTKPLCQCGSAAEGDGVKGTVNVVSGEFKFPVIPVDIPAARGFDFRFNMTYRSRSPNATAIDSLFGPGWDYGYGAYLKKAPGGIIYRFSGDGTSDRYSWDAAAQRYWAPRGGYDYIVRKAGAVQTHWRLGAADTYYLVDRYGRNETYVQDGTSSIYRLTKITEPTGNSMLIWPTNSTLSGGMGEACRFSPCGAVLDTHNRLIYFNKWGIYEYESLQLNDTTDRIAEYKVTFNWATAQWEIRDSFGHRLYEDPHDGVPHWDPMPPNRTKYEFEYKNNTWTKLDWDPDLPKPSYGNWVKGDWAGGDWLGRDPDDDDDETQPPTTTQPQQAPDSNHDRDTLDNWPNCTYDPSEECVPDANVNWTLNVRTLATFTYDQAEYLKRIDLPDGGGTSFTYDENGRLHKVGDAYGIDYITNQYDRWGRVLSQHYGYGDYTFWYDTPHRVTRVTDRNGNVVDYYYQHWSRPLTWQKVEWTNRNMQPTDPDYFITKYSYNRNMELMQVRHPRGNLDMFIWDDTNPDPLQQGNLICEIKDPGPYVYGPDGEEQLPIITRYTYEPVFNRMATKEDARGQYPGYLPPNGGDAYAARYTTRFYYEHQEAQLGDLNLDGAIGLNHPNLVRVEYPIVNIYGKPHEEFGNQYSVQQRVETWIHNARSQVVKHTDVTGMNETWDYFGSNNESGIFRHYTTGPTPWTSSNANLRTEHVENLIVAGALFDPTDSEGYLKQYVKDADGFRLFTNYTRDRDGNPATISDGAGNTYTLKFRSGCLLSNVTSPAPFNYQTMIKRDKNGQPVNVTRQVDTGFFTTENTTYDILGHPLRVIKDAKRPAEAPATTQDLHPTTYYCYDLNENLIMERRPESANGHQLWDLTSTVYDERDQAISTTRGNVTPMFWLQPRAPSLGCLSSSTDQTVSGNPRPEEPSIDENVQVEVFQGDVFAGAVALRNQGTGTINVPGFSGPALRATLYWEVLNPTPTNLVTFDGIPLTGTLVGSGDALCWPGGDTAWAYKADVTVLVSGPGPYTVTIPSGSTANDDPWTDPLTPTPFAEGATLIAIGAGDEWHEVATVEKYRSLSPGDETWHLPRASPGSGSSNLIVLGGDGQSASEVMYWNGAFLASNSWDGSAPQSVPNFSYGNLWDTDSFAVTSNQGNNAFRVLSGTDCVGPMAAIMSTPTDAPSGPLPIPAPPFLPPVSYVHELFGLIPQESTDDLPLVESTTYRFYDGNGNLVAELDGEGYPTMHQFDGYDREIATTDALGGRSDKKYDVVHNVVEERFCGYATPNGVLSPTRKAPVWPIVTPILSCFRTPLPTGTQLYTVTRHRHDEANRQYQTDDLFQSLHTGRPLQDGRLTGNDTFVSSLTEYDKAGRTVRTVNDNVHHSRTFYDSAGRVNLTIDAAGNRVIKLYDALGNAKGERRIDVHSPGGTVAATYETNSTHDSLGRKDSTTNAHGDTSQSAFNAGGAKTRTLSPLNNTVRHTYDALQRLLMDTYVLKVTWTTPPANTAFVTNKPFDKRYNDDWQQTTIVFANHTTAVFAGQPTDQSDPLGVHVIQGTLLKLGVESDWLNVTYDYDADGRLASMRDGINQKTTYTYDPLGRKTRETFADGTYMAFRYDRRDLVKELRDPNGNVATTWYDALGRATNVRATLGSGVIGTDRQDFVYDAQGRKVQQWDNNTQDPGHDSYLSRSYDSLGHAWIESENWQTAYSQYDGMGNRLSFTYPNFRQLNYTYDELERPKEIWDLAVPRGGGDLWPDSVKPVWTLSEDNGGPARPTEFPGDERLASYTYVGPSHLDTRRLGENIVQTNVYDGANDRLDSLVYRNATGVLRVGFEYTFDKDGRLTNKDKLHQSTDDESYTMDSIGRLTAFERPSTAAADLKAQEWNLDDANNWNQTARDFGSGDVTEARHHSATNALKKQVAGTTTNLAYDANGNLKDDGTLTYKWDFKNRLREVAARNGPVVARYDYDAENRRVRKELPQELTTTVYFSDGMNEVQESDCYGNVLRQYVYGRGVDELILQDEPYGTVAAVARTCAFTMGSGTPGLMGSLQACSPDNISWPRLDAVDQLLEDLSEEGHPLSGVTRPVALLIDSTVNGQASCICGVGTMGAGSFAVSVGCEVCVVDAWGTAMASPSPVGPGCLICYNAVVFIAPLGTLGGCTPCGPAWVGLATPFDPDELGRAWADVECMPCPQGNGQLLLIVDNANPANPTIMTPEAGDTEHCIGIDLDARRWFLQDEQRTVYGLANRTGFVKEGYEYDPYGTATVFEPATASGAVTFTAGDVVTDADDADTSYLYTGRRYDAESGLHYYRSRYYDSELGRFVSRDTIGVWGDVISLGNSYVYVANRANVATDPSGTQAVDVLKAVAKLLELNERIIRGATSKPPPPSHPNGDNNNMKWLKDSRVAGKMRYVRDTDMGKCDRLYAAFPSSWTRGVLCWPIIYNTEMIIEDYNTYSEVKLTMPERMTVIVGYTTRGLVLLLDSDDIEEGEWERQVGPPPPPAPEEKRYRWQTSLPQFLVYAQVAE